MFPHDYPYHPCSYPLTVIQTLTRTFGRRAGSNHLGSCISCRQRNPSIENGSDLTWTTIPPRIMVEWDPPSKFRAHFPESFSTEPVEVNMFVLSSYLPLNKYLCCNCFLMLYLDHAESPEVQQGIYPWQSRDTVLQGLSSSLTLRLLGAPSHGTTLSGGLGYIPF